MEVTAELSYALNTFYFLVCGALVMWMAAGFAMLEAVWFEVRTRPRFDKERRTVCYRLHYVHGCWLRHHVWRRHFLGWPSGRWSDWCGRASRLCAVCRLFFQVVFVATQCRSYRAPLPSA